MAKATETQRQVCKCGHRRWMHLGQLGTGACTGSNDTCRCETFRARQHRDEA